MTDILKMQRAGRRPATGSHFVATVALFVILASILFGAASSRQDPFSRNLSASKNLTIPGSYRGYRVVPLGAGLAVPELELAAASPQALYREVNTLLFRAASGRVDYAVEEQYAAADRNGDGILSENEIERFVRSLSAGERGVGLSGLLSYWGVERPL